MICGDKMAYLTNGERRQETATQKDMLNGRLLELRTQIVACPHLRACAEQDLKRIMRTNHTDVNKNHTRAIRALYARDKKYGDGDGEQIWAYPRVCLHCSYANSCRTYLKLHLGRIVESSGVRMGVNVLYEGGRTGWQGLRGWKQRHYQKVDSMEEFWGE